MSTFCKYWECSGATNSPDERKCSLTHEEKADLSRGSAAGTTLPVYMAMLKVLEVWRISVTVNVFISDREELQK